MMFYILSLECEVDLHLQCGFFIQRKDMKLLKVLTSFMHAYTVEFCF